MRGIHFLGGGKISLDEVEKPKANEKKCCCKSDCVWNLRNRQTPLT